MRGAAAPRQRLCADEVRASRTVLRRPFLSSTRLLEVELQRQARRPYSALIQLRETALTARPKIKDVKAYAAKVRQKCRPGDTIQVNPIGMRLHPCATSAKRSSPSHHSIST